MILHKKGGDEKKKHEKSEGKENQNENVGKGSDGGKKNQRKSKKRQGLCQKRRVENDWALKRGLEG